MEVAPKHKKRAILGAFFMFRDGGGVENFSNMKNTPIRVSSSCLLGGGDGGGGARRGGGMSVDMKKKRKKRWVYLVRPARCFSVPL